MSLRQCGNCMSYDHPSNTCRVNPPVIGDARDLDGAHLGYWPKVRPNEWCQSFFAPLPADYAPPSAKLKK